jgi:hypothetical protein
MQTSHKTECRDHVAEGTNVRQEIKRKLGLLELGRRQQTIQSNIRADSSLSDRERPDLTSCQGLYSKSAARPRGLSRATERARSHASVSSIRRNKEHSGTDDHGMVESIGFRVRLEVRATSRERDADRESVSPPVHREFIVERGAHFVRSLDDFGHRFESWRVE